MKLKITYIIPVLVMLLPIGCKKENFSKSAFEQPAKAYELSVDGGINTLTQTQYIKLSKPALRPGELPVPISNAEVIVNDSKNDILFKQSAIPGIYQGVNHNAPNYNKAYKLTVKYNGKTYTAIDTLRQVINIVDDFLPLSIASAAGGIQNGTIPKHTFGYLNPSKWFIGYRDAPVWNPSAFDQNSYYSYTHRLGSPNSLYPLNNLKRSFSLKQDDEIFILKMSLSDRYASYLYSVFMETDWSGLLSGVPVNVQGNVSGNAQGYFSVSDIDVRLYRASEL